MKPEEQAENLTKIKRIEAALRSPLNIFGICACIAATAILLTPWPIAVGLAAEILYLIIGAGVTSPVTVTVTLGQHTAESPAKSTLAAKLSAHTLSAPISVPGDADCVPPADLLTGDVQGRYLRLEATFRLIQLQLDQSEGTHRELLEHMRFLMDRFVYFASKQETLHERLQAVAADARALRPAISAAANAPDLQLVYAPGETGEYRSLDEWVQAKMKVAHDGYEQALREVASQRDLRDGEPAIRLEAHAKHLLRCNKTVDKVGKTLLNLHY